MNQEKRILIADDDLTSRIALGGVLEKWGYTVDCYDNGDDAFNRLSSCDDYPVAILDWMMNGMDGIEICQRLSRSRKKESCYLILLTARQGLIDVINGLEAGANDYVVKPFEPEELHARVRVGIRVSRLQRDLKRYSEEMESLAEHRAQQLVHADRLSTIGTLTSGVAHEVNNPLSFISGNLRFLKDCWPTISRVLKESRESGKEDKDLLETILTEIPKTLQGIKTGVDRISHIVDGLKFYARKGKAEKKNIDLALAVEQSLELCQNRLKYGIKVEFIKPDNVMVLGDIQQLQQVFVNLLVNAADSLEGRDNAKIVIRIVEDRDTVIITFSDNGQGFSPGFEENLFKPFFTTKDVGKGTGLGLAICQGIIENHGGEIMANNIETGGACLTITLPRQA